MAESGGVTESRSATVPDVLDAGDHDGSEQQEGEQVAVADEDGGVAAAAKLDLRRAVGQDQPDRGRGAGGRVQLMPELPPFFHQPKTLCMCYN